MGRKRLAHPGATIRASSCRSAKILNIQVQIVVLVGGRQPDPDVNAMNRPSALTLADGRVELPPGLLALRKAHHHSAPGLPHFARDHPADFDGTVRLISEARRVTVVVASIGVRLTNSTPSSCSMMCSISCAMSSVGIRRRKDDDARVLSAPSLRDISVDARTVELPRESLHEQPHVEPGVRLPTAGTGA